MNIIKSFNVGKNFTKYMYKSAKLGFHYIVDESVEKKLDEYDSKFENIKSFNSKLQKLALNVGLLHRPDRWFMSSFYIAASF